MIKSGLPYVTSQMSTIKRDGAIVDMSNLAFPNVPADKQVYTALVYLRNTNFPVTLDTSAMTKHDKFELLLAYLTKNIDINLDQLITTWVRMLIADNDCCADLESILTREEEVEFMESHHELIVDAKRLIISLPVYLMMRSSQLTEMINDGSIERTDSTPPIGVNLKHIVKNDYLTFVYTNIDGLAPLIYSSIFTLENNELFNSLVNTSVGVFFLAGLNDQLKLEE